MRILLIPQRLKTEFATVESVWHSGAQTRRVDSLLLSWVKYEKQLRRLFCFLVFQHPHITEHAISNVINSLAQHNHLYPETFTRGIDAMGATPVRVLVGPRYAEMSAEIKRIKRYRNKLVHGQVSGNAITSSQLERDVAWIVDWVAALAEGAHATLGYDGLGRNTFKTAKTTPAIPVQQYPFSNPHDFGAWLRTL
jgi:hypothetical protein